MDDLISRAAAIECAIDAVDDWDGGWNPNRETVIRKYFEELHAVDAAPIKPLSVWLAGYAVPPKYTVETNPVDSAKARAEGWEKHIRNLIECGLMEEE